MKVINKLEGYPTRDMLVPYCPNCDNPTYSERKCPFCNTELEYEEMIEKGKEIERLQRLVTTYDELLLRQNNKVDMLHSIIKEVREWANKTKFYFDFEEEITKHAFDLLYTKQGQELLEILNKENK